MPVQYQDTYANPFASAHPAGSRLPTHYTIGNEPVPYTPAPDPSLQDYGVFDIHSGQIIGLHSRKPFTGKVPGGRAVNGVFQPDGSGDAPPTNANPLDPTSRFKPYELPKDPAISDATKGVLDEFKSTADTALKDFGSYLANFKTQIGSANAKAAAATDINPTVAALTGATNRFSGALTNDAANFASANAATTAGEQGIVKQAQDLLPSYDQAATDASNVMLDRLGQQAGRFKLGTGTPESLGGAELAALGAGVANIEVPLQEAKIGRRYDLLQNLNLPVTRDIGSRLTQQYGTVLPQLSQLDFSSATGLANSVQTLKQMAATMSYQDALAYMQSIAVPPQVIQAVLGGQIQNLGGLAALNNETNYRGLQDLVPVQPTATQTFNMGTPAIPTNQPNLPIMPRTSTGTSTGTSPAIPQPDRLPSPYLQGGGGLPYLGPQPGYGTMGNNVGADPYYNTAIGDFSAPLPTNPYQGFDQVPDLSTYA